MSLDPYIKDQSRLLNQAVDSGINYFDTADFYDQGSNESIVGRALGSRRKEVILATKVGNVWDKNGKTWHWNPSKNHILSAVERSLNRLGTDYIDLYQLHGGTLEDPIDETIDAFETLVQSGKIRYYGLSSIRPNVIRTYVEKSNITSVMLQYSLLDRRSEEQLLPLLQTQDIGVQARGVLAKGLLEGKTPCSYLDRSEEDIDLLQQKLLKKRIPNAATAFVLAHEAINTSVIGLRTEQQLSDLIHRTSCLDEVNLKWLRKCFSQNYYQSHL
jgi:aryl-alcohol dehydrogenase-like predicted oxidoreductase